jgi:phospholipase/carboxylesterase
MTVGNGRLQARPQESSSGVRRGLVSLGQDKTRGGLLYVPSNYQPGTPAPLMVMFHGAGGAARGGLAPMSAHADAAGVILLALSSRSSTWDVLHGGFGPDVAALDAALSSVFDRYAVSPQCVVAEGFSDGASYALSLGLTNGDLFTHVIAFSPGFMAPAGVVDRPAIFISHGTEDRVLPIDSCSRRIVPVLRAEGYAVCYREFEGGHTVPVNLVSEALVWLETGRCAGESFV